jgi:hypothetical protein
MTTFMARIVGEAAAVRRPPTTSLTLLDLQRFLLPRNMSAIFEWMCGESMCKRQFSAALPDTPRPWPIRCPKCNRSLYPDDLLQLPEAGEVMVPDRAELRVWTGGRSVECTANELRRMQNLPERSKPRGLPPSPPRAPAVALESAPSASIKRFSRGKVALAGAAMMIIVLIILLLVRA